MEEPNSIPSGDSGTPTPAPIAAAKLRDRTWLIWMVILPAIFALGLGTGYLVWGRNIASEATTAEVQVPENVRRYDIPITGNPSIGPEDAEITIVEFSDYQCPYCKRWHDDVFGRLLQDYPDQVRIVYRDFPLTSIHPEAYPAAEAALCAGEQGAYWPYHSALFSQKYALGDSAYEKYAVELGLDTSAFAQCQNEGRYSDEIAADLEFATDLGIGSTPTFFINGIALVGAQPYDVFKQVIDLELAGEIPNE
jgi:protein-disulfide isomerase